MSEQDPGQQDQVDGDVACNDDAADGGGDEPVIEPPGPTQIASSVERLRRAAVNAAKRRQRLPHYLFWSLFRLEAEGIRAKKVADREHRESLYYSDPMNRD